MANERFGNFVFYHGSLEELNSRTDLRRKYKFAKELNFEWKEMGEDSVFRGGLGLLERVVSTLKHIGYDGLVNSRTSTSCLIGNIYTLTVQGTPIIFE